MLNPWLRQALRRIGLEVPFTGVVCPEEVKCVAIDRNTGAVVTVRRLLVFLEAPQAGDLQDTILDPAIDGALYASPDGIELSRKRSGRATIVNWRPREPVAPLTLYSHEYSWHASGEYTHPAVCTEIACELRTGVLVLEMLTPGTFETAIVFKRPRWRRLANDRSIIKYALSQLDTPGDRPVVSEFGRKLQWRVVGPRVGERYICVAFHQYGVAQAQQRLKETSLLGRLLQLIRPLRPA